VIARRLLRHAQNEQRFREANERVPFGPASEAVAFLCERGVPECEEFIACPLEDYMRTRRWDSRFLLVPGHEIPGFERVVERHERWVVVQTLEPVRRLENRSGVAPERRRGGGRRTPNATTPS
jgi:hypothetical protein